MPPVTSQASFRRSLGEVNQKLDNLAQFMKEAGETAAEAFAASAAGAPLKAPWDRPSSSSCTAIVPVRRTVTLDNEQLLGITNSVRNLCTLAESTERFADALSAQVRAEKDACQTALRRLQRIADDNDVRPDARHEYGHCITSVGFVIEQWSEASEPPHSSTARAATK